MKHLGFTAGAFDLVHAGHVLMFKEAKEHCEFLIVALHRDPSIERPEKNKPVMSVAERRIILEGCRYIDLVIEYDTEADLVRLLEGIRPDVRFLGRDWLGKEYTGKHLSYIAVHFNQRDHGFSSSELRERIKNASS